MSESNPGAPVAIIIALLVGFIFGVSVTTMFFVESIHELNNHNSDETQKRE